MFNAESIANFLNELPKDKPVFISVNGLLYDIGFIDNNNDEIIITVKGN